MDEVSLSGIASPMLTDGFPVLWSKKKTRVESMINIIDPSKRVPPAVGLPLVDGLDGDFELASAGLIPQRGVLEGQRGTAGC